MEKLQVMSRYSDYTLQIYCNVADVSGEITVTNQGTGAEAWLAGIGCCLRDESQYGGGYCALSNNNAIEAEDLTSNVVTDIDTYFLTNEEFREVMKENATIASTRKYHGDINTKIATTYAGIETFLISDVGGTYTSFTATKAQPFPAAGWDAKYRFEKGDKAIGYIRFMYRTGSTGAWVYSDVSADTSKGYFDKTIAQSVYLNGAIANSLMAMSMAGLMTAIVF